MTNAPNAPADQRPAKSPLAGNKNFIFDDGKRFIFAFVPKVACTNWKSILRYMAGHKDYLDNRLAHDRKNGGLHYLDLSGPELDLVMDPGVPKYSFIRNPYSRALSAYLNKVESRIERLEVDDEADHFLKVAREIDSFRKAKMDTDRHPVIDFQVFLQFLLTSGHYFRNDEHWVSQTSLLGWPHVTFDFIGRFENMGPDSAEILARMGCDIGFPSQKEVNFPATGAANRLVAYLTPDCARLVEELYAADFDNFDYPRRT